MLCGRWGGVEMCWSKSKGISLLVVVCGILIYGSFTEKDRGRKDVGNTSRGSARTTTRRKRGEYKSVGDAVAASGEEGRIMCV
mmetsp:Transcript_11085/g.20770  ORF Transcript_11085/g.20770 Transcript_11085/m.20770 type:complete len:83 (+) Transcript_11085:2313-2561(+)